MRTSIFTTVFLLFMSFSAFAQLVGEYTIGGINPDYSTLSAATDALQQDSILGSVIFNIKEGTYVEDIELGTITGATSNNHITFRGEVGEEVVITNPTGDYIFNLDSTNYVNFEDIIFSNPVTSSAFLMRIGQDCDSIMFSECTFHIGDNGRGIHSPYFSSNHLLIDSCIFENGYYGVQMANSGITIQNSVFNNQSRRGIFVGGENLIIKSNTINNDIQYFREGIYIDYGESLLIEKNKILLENGGLGIYIDSYSGSEHTTDLLVNNMITVKDGEGIYLREVDSLDLYFNTVLTWGDESSDSDLLYIDNLTSSVKVQNNIFSNQRGGYAVYIEEYQDYIFDYNDYHSTGEYIVQYDGQDMSKLDGWQIGLGVNSYSVSPLFTSNTNLHSNQGLLNGAGTEIDGIVDDLDGIMRDTPPDIGAYEFTPTGDNVALLNIYPKPPFSEGNYPIEVELLNSGANTLDFVTVNWSMDSIPQNPLFWTGNLPTGETTLITLDSLFSFEEITSYSITATASQPNGTIDIDTTDNAIERSNFYTALEGLYTIGGISPDFTTFPEVENALNYGGVKGSVIIEIREGEYDAQLNLTDILGTSVNNTITFRGEAESDAIINGSGGEYIFNLNTTNHIRFENIILSGVDDTNRLVTFEDGSDSLIFTKCIFEIGDNEFGIYGDSPNSDNLLIDSCYFSDGDYGIGISSSELTLTNNTFNNQQRRSVYTVGANMTIASNTIINNIANFESGIYILNSDSTLLLEKNKILLENGGTGIYVSFYSGSEYEAGIIANNVITVKDGTGIYLSSTDYLDLYFNSILTWGTANTYVPLDLYYGTDYITAKNNIFSNQFGGYSVYIRGDRDYIFDYNNYHSTGEYIAQDDGQDISNFDDWQSIGLGFNSYSTSPIFTSNIDLHSNQAQLDAAGVEINSITEDLDGVVRSLPPDIGAYEFMPTGDNVTLLKLTHPEPPFDAGVHPIEVELLNSGANTLDSVTINWHIDSIPQNPILWTGNLPKGETTIITLDSLFSFEEITPYSITAITSQPNGTTDIDTSDDTLEIANLYTTIGGLYTVGGISPNFMSLTEVENVLNFGGIKSPVIFDIRQGEYEAQINLTNIKGISKDNTITFSGEAEAEVTISNSVGEHIFNLDATDHVYFENIIFSVPTTSSTYLINLNNGCDSIRLSRCTFNVGVDGRGISSSASSNLQIDSCLFNNGDYGVYGSSDGFNVTNNTFNNQSSRSISINGTDININSNSIINSVQYFIRGISVSCDSNLVISKNKILLEKGGTGLYINSYSGSENTRGLVSNNIISVKNGVGIHLRYPHYLDLYFNNVLTWGTQGSYPLYVYKFASFITAKNNIFSAQNERYAISILETQDYTFDYNDYYTTGDYVAFYSDGQSGSATNDLQSLELGANSYSISPVFDSETDLRSNQALLDGAGIQINGINEDLDGVIRSVPPDIGAYEFTSTGDNVTLLNLIHPEAPFDEGEYPIQVELLNSGATTLNSVVIDWYIDSIPQSPILWAGSLPTGATELIDLDSLFNFEEMVAYSITAFASQPNGQVDIDSTDNFVEVANLYTTIGGEYTVGNTGDFENLTDVENVLNFGGINSPVVFNFLSGSHYIENIHINEVFNNSPENTITFQSASGVNATIVLYNPNSISKIYFDGTDYIRFNNLTFDLHSSNDPSTVLQFDNSSDVLVNDCAFEGNAVALRAIDSGNFHVKNSIFDNIRNGISAEGNESLTIENNEFNFQRSGSTIFCENNDSIHITKNTIRRSNLYFNYGECVEITNLSFGLIEKNVISSSSDDHSIWISSYQNDNDNIRIANNMIRARYNGITIRYIDFAECYFNNVHTFDDSALKLYDTNIISKNNIFSTQADQHIVVSTNSLLESNYNAYYNSINSAGMFNYNEVILDSLDNWQSTTGEDMNSIVADPMFISTSDLHVQNPVLNNAGITINGIVDDIDDEPRGTPPDIGADEFTPVFDNDIQVVGVLSPSQCNIPPTDTLTIEIYNNGTNIQTGFEVGVIVNGNTITENVGSFVVNPGESAIYNFVTSIDFTTFSVENIVVYTLLSNDQNASNDSFSFTIINDAPEAVSNMLPVDGTIFNQQSISLSWFPSNGATHYDIFIWDTNSEMPNTPYVSGITQINYTGSFDLGTTYNWQVVTVNSCYETPGPIQQFSLSPPPDLSVTNISLPANPFTNQEVEISWIVSNTGLGSTLDGWYDQIYLSNDQFIGNADDKLLKVIPNNSALNSGESYAQSTTVTLPVDGDGMKYIIITTDYLNQITESNENNNESSQTMFITLTPPPDLIVNSVVAPIDIFSESTINFTYSIENVGAGPTVEGLWEDRFFISSTPYFSDDTSEFLKSAQRQSNIEANDTITYQESVVIPQGYEGDHYIHVVTDFNNDVFEFASEDNNVGVSNVINVIIAPQPDLFVSEVTSSHDTVSNNQNISIAYSIINQGASQATENWTNRVFISRLPVFLTDSVIGLRSIYMSTDLDFGQSETQSTTISIPKEINGDYYLFFVVDYLDAVFEHTGESNNISSPYPLYVKSPDLTVSDIQIPDMVNSGENYELSWKITNIGDGDLYSSNRKDRLFLSTSPNLDIGTPIEIGEIQYNTDIASSSSLTKSLNATLPNGIEGNYYLIIRTDADNYVFENGLDDNNDFAIPLNISLSPWADLSIVSVTGIPSNAVAGDTVDISIMIGNSGSKNIEGKSWNDKIYLSPYPVYDPNDVRELVGIETIQSLAVGETYTINASFPIPMLNGINAGNCFIHIVTDQTDKIYEHTSENNNVYSSNPIAVVAPPRTDFEVVDAWTEQDTMFAGDEITATWTVTNLSTTTSLWNYPLWYDGIYLSTDSIWSQNDIFAKDFTISGPLNMGEDYSMTQSLNIPNGIEGDFYVLLATNHTEVVDEDEFANNYQSAGLLHVEPGLYPDLAVTSTSISNNQGIAGQPLTFYYTIINYGEKSANAGTFSDELHISTDFDIDYGDIQVGQNISNQTILPGESHSDSITFFIPIQYSGNYALLLKTDGNNALFEQEENNNIGSQFISVFQPAPSNLAVGAITHPSIARTGNTILVDCEIENIGVNPADGVWTDKFYLSKNDSFDIEDVEIGDIELSRLILPLEAASFQLETQVPGVTPGDYHVLVRTDAFNNILEDNELDNIGVSVGKIMVALPELFIDSLQNDTLVNGAGIYYSLQIDSTLAEETLLLNLTSSDMDGINTMFISREAVPTASNHDFSGVEPNSNNQQIIVPTLVPGTYYILITGNSTGANEQPIEILASILPFEIISVESNRGGNTGNVTIKLTGAKFTPDMQIRLDDDSNIYQGMNLQYISSSEVFVTFNLSDAQLGVYDVIAENNAGDLAVLDNGFEIIEGVAFSGSGDDGFVCSIENIGGYELLNENIVTPAAVRINRVVSITIQYSNNGTIDLPAPSRFLLSLRGAPLALDVDDLDRNDQELYLEFREYNGPPNILRPGASGSLTLYTFSSHPLRFLLKE